MNSAFKAVVLLTVATILCAATFILVPRLRNSAAVSDGYESTDEEEVLEDEAEAENSFTADSSGTSSPRTRQSARNRFPDSFDGDREQSKFDVAEMRNELEEMVRKFRGTPEERQEVIEECEGGKELIRLFAELSESSIENMSPDELEKERENFEKEYRAQLDFIQTGQLQRMLRTPEEEEVIGSTIEAVQEFLERIDGALHSAGY
jgi:flagellar biosynthesis GTPase FlhF